MRPHLKYCALTLGAVAVIATLWSATRPAVVIGQSAPAYKAARTADGQPDLSGFWQAVNTAYWNLEDHGVQASPHKELLGTYLAQPAGMSVVEGGTIPYKPEGLERRKKHFENRLNPDPFTQEDGVQDSSDPEARCFQGGVPRVAYMPFPFQIIQTKTKILLAYEFAGSARVVHLDVGRKELLDIDTWMGQSVGRWEGDTLVVEAKGFVGRTWLDRAGNYVSPTAVVTERYTPHSPYHLMYEATIDDPTVFTRPWKIKMPLYRRIDTNMQLLEFECLPIAEEYVFKSLIKK